MKFTKKKDIDDELKQIFGEKMVKKEQSEEKSKKKKMVMYAPKNTLKEDPEKRKLEREQEMTEKEKEKLEKKQRIEMWKMRK